MTLNDIGTRIARLLPPERAHRLAHWALGRRLLPAVAPDAAPVLATEAWGRHLPNPLGIAAGFDKDAEVIDGLFRLGLGFVEVGGVTPRPQPGNPRPRLFRLPDDRALVNRMGLNGKGKDYAAARLAAFRVEGRYRDRMVGVNLGANKDSADPAADYAEGVAALGAHADFLTINVSSPNTPGLRDLQARSRLEALLAGVAHALDALSPRPDGRRPALLIKISPDLGDEAAADIADLAVALRRSDGARLIDGLIVSNTTVARPPSLVSAHRTEAGGLSGEPLFEPSTRLLADMYRATGGAVPLIGVGGVASGAQAYRKIRAGASLVQLYTAMVYQGPMVFRTILGDLAQRLQNDGFQSVSEAVGADHEGSRGPSSVSSRALSVDSTG